MSSTDTQTMPTSNDQPPSNGITVAHPTEQLLGDSPPNNPSVKFETDAFEDQKQGAELISKAQSFLESPELQEKDLESKTQYLVTKGVPEETVDELQKALSSIPVIPPRTYPEALVSPARSRLFDNLLTIYYFFTYAAGASAILTFAYSKFILPRWSRMITAKHRLRVHQLNLVRRLKDDLTAHKESVLTTSSIAPVVESKPELSTKLQELRAQVPDLPPKTTRQHALQTLSNLTGYLSSQLHLTSGLDSAIRSYQFQFSMPGAASGAPKDDVQDQIKKDIRALKGLLINRRTFLQGSSTLSTSQRMY